VLPAMAFFKPGDVVVWVRAVPEPRNRGVQGVVTAIAESGDGAGDEFTQYEVRFPFGVAILYGTQIEPAPKDTAQK
jgi:hypothetical protein